MDGFRLAQLHSDPAGASILSQELTFGCVEETAKASSERDWNSCSSCRMSATSSFWRCASFLCSSNSYGLHNEALPRLFVLASSPFFIGTIIFIAPRALVCFGNLIIYITHTVQQFVGTTRLGSQWIGNYERNTSTFLGMVRLVTSWSTSKVVCARSTQQLQVLLKSKHVCTTAGNRAMTLELVTQLCPKNRKPCTSSPDT